MQKIIMRISALVTLILLMIIGIMISQGYQAADRIREDSSRKGVVFTG